MNRSWIALARESLRVAAVTRVVSGLVLLLAMVVPAAILGTAGLSIEAQASILRRVDEMGSRIVTMVTTGGRESAIPATAVDRVARLEGVGWVLGLGPVFDARTRQGTGGPTPVRAYRAVRAPVEFGESPAGPGAFVSAVSIRRLGLGGAYSMIDPGGIDVVGWFRAREPLEVLDDFILVPSDDDGLMLERLIVAVEDVGWVDPVVANLPALVGDDAAAFTTVQRGAGLLAAREAVRDEVTSRDRQLVVLLLAVAMGVACLVVFAGTVAARRDFGRRRALGATRAQLTVLVMLTTLWPAVVGVLVGAAAGWLYVASRLGGAPTASFPVAVAVLTVLALVTASAIPAAVAATRDPLQVLRTP